MKPDKLFAMAAYAYQAFAMLALVLGVGHFLAASEYGRYSLVVATLQGVSVFAFDWIRQAATRFCVDSGDSSGEEKKQTILSAFFVMALVLLLAAVGASVFIATDWRELVLGVFVAILIGATDLQLVFLRVQGGFSKFSFLQTARASFLLLSSVAFSYHFGSAVGALGGLLLGYFVTLVLFLWVAPTWWRLNPAQARKHILFDIAKYGVSAASAAVIGLQVPLLLRWCGRHYMSAEQFAGFSMAMDILQKPFSLVTTAIGGVLSPGVISFYEKSPSLPNPNLKKMYEAQIWAVLSLFACICAFLPDASVIFLKKSMQEGFMSVGFCVALIFSLHTLIQTTLAIPGHLLKAGPKLIANSLLEFTCVVVSVIPAAYFKFGLPFGWLWVSAIAVFFSGLYGLRLIKRIPCEKPSATLIVAPSTMMVVGLGYFWSVGLAPLMSLKILIVMFVFLLALRIYRHLNRVMG